MNIAPVNMNVTNNYQTKKQTNPNFKASIIKETPTVQQNMLNLMRTCPEEYARLQKMLPLFKDTNFIHGLFDIGSRGFSIELLLPKDFEFPGFPKEETKFNDEFSVIKNEEPSFIKFRSTDRKLINLTKCDDNYQGRKVYRFDCYIKDGWDFAPKEDRLPMILGLDANIKRIADGSPYRLPDGYDFVYRPIVTKEEFEADIQTNRDAKAKYAKSLEDAAAAEVTAIDDEHLPEVSSLLRQYGLKAGQA